MKKSIHTWLRALRVNQWTKNGIVFLAWFFAVADPSQAAMARGIRPFILVAAMATAICLVSSAFYLLNDVADFEEATQPTSAAAPSAATIAAAKTSFLCMTSSCLSKVERTMMTEVMFIPSSFEPSQNLGTGIAR